MSFTLGGSTITQTGTDTNLSDIALLSGVTTQTKGSITLYDIGNRRLIVQGTLTIDPEIETLLIGYNNGNLVDVINGAELIIGRAITINGFTRYSEGLAIYLDDYPGGFTNRFTFRDGANLTWNGGIISMPAGKFGFYGDNCTVRINSLNAKLIYRTTDPQNQIRQETDDFISTAFELINGDLTVVGTNQQLNGYQPTQCSGAIAFSSATPNVDVFFRGYAGGGRGNFIDVKMWQGSRPYLINCVTGTELNVGAHISGDNNSFGILRVFQELTLNIVEFGAGAIEGAKIWLQDTNHGNRRLYNQESPNIDLRDTITYIANSDANGDVPTQEILIGSVIADSTYGGAGSAVNTGRFAWDYRGKNNDTSDLFDIRIISYNHALQSLIDVELKGAKGTTALATMFLDFNITEADKATVDTYVAIENTSKFYDRAKAFLYDNFAGESETIVSLSGNEIDLGSYNLIIDTTASNAFTFDGSTITIKASIFTGDLITTGTITLQNGANINGTYTDQSGTVAPPNFGNITDIIPNSRVQLYNETTNSELYNSIVTSNSYSYSYQEGTEVSNGDTIRLRITYTNGITAKKGFTATTVANNGFSFLASQVDDEIYNNIGLDGSTITKFDADYLNNEVDIITSSDFSAEELYARFSFFTYTEQGIRNFFGGLKANDGANFENDVTIIDLYLNNNSASNLKQIDNIRLFKSNGAYPVRNPTTGGGGIDVVWREKVFIAETGVSGLTTNEATNLSSIKALTDKLETMIENVSGERFTTKALEQAPSNGGGASNNGGFI